jgi:non-specific serine/threonine protein kinase/serine/threonine-protein kinase
MPLAAATAVVLALLTGAVGIAIQAHQTAIERDLAFAEARRSDSIVQTLTLLLGASPGAGDQTLKQTLDQSATRLLATLDGSERSGQAVVTLGELFVNIQDPQASFALYKGALDRGIGKQSALWTARIRAGLADAAISIGQGDSAPALLDQADAVFRTDPERFAVDHQGVLLDRAAIARRKGDYDTALAVLNEDLPLAERALAANDSALLTRYNNMLVYMIEANRAADVPALLQRIDRTLAHPGARDSIQAINIDQLRGTWQIRQGDAAAAEQTFVSAVARRRRLFGASAGLATDLTQLGKARLAQRDFAGARAALAEAEPLAMHFLGAAALPTIVTKLALAQAQAELGETQVARATLGDVAQAMAPLPTPNPLTGQYAMTEAVLALNERHKPEAEAAAGRARASFKAMGPAGAFALKSVDAIDRRIAALP